MNVIYGVHPVQEILRSVSDEIIRILVLKGKKDRDIEDIQKRALQRGVVVERADREFLNEIAGNRNHQGVICICRDYTYLSFEKLLDTCKGVKAGSVVLIFDGIMDPHNLGSLIRTGYCFGVKGVIIPKDRAASVTPAVSKASAGAVQHVPVVQVVNLARAIDELKNQGFWIYGAEAPSENDFNCFDYSGHIGVVLGSEGKGMRPLIRKKCDFLISIPMVGNFDSLNVSVAGGILLYKIMEKRKI